jgi:hypothetical protein
MIFKVFLAAFALFAILKAWKQFKERKQSLYWFWLSSLFWGVVIFVAFLPQTTDVVARYVGVERGADLLVYIAVVVLSYGFYRSMVQQERMRQEITELTRQIAIRDAKKK